MPKLWTDTIEAHRRAVHHAVLDATATLVTRHGLKGVTMAGIAEETGIGRATVYKHFKDVETILHAWHERHLQEHLAHLQHARTHAGTGAEQLHAVLHAFAELTHDRQDGDLAALLHRGPHVTQAQAHLRRLLADLITEGARDGTLRDDVPPDELAAFCLHALTAAGTLPSRDAAHRLVTVTLAGLRRPA